MNEGAVAVRVFTLLILAWPAVATALVYAVRRRRISRVGAYCLEALGLSYLLSLLGPLAIVVLLMVVGVVAELATLYTIFLGIPLFAALPVLVALRAASRSSRPPA